MTSDQEAAVLGYDPWAGEDGDARTMSDAFVVTRKQATCAICMEDIPSGSRVRAQRQVSREMRKAMTFRFCAACCSAMALARADDGEAIDLRTNIGIAAARQAFERRAASEASR